MSHLPTASGVSHKPSPQSSKKRASPSGFSLLARGEPQIWFTGGMLVVCLVMILALLAFILYAGLPTFWPREIHWLVLNDGALEIGQPQRIQAVAPADARPQDAAATPADSGLRRYYRTGNYDLTAQHYRWLSAVQLDASGIVRPTWGMVVERVEHGRLYGLLGQLALEIQPGEPAKRELASLRELRELLADIPDAEAELLSSIDSAITARASQTLSDALRAAAADDGRRVGILQVQLIDEADWRISSPKTEAGLITAVRRLVSDETEILAELQTVLANTNRLRKRTENLHYRVSRFDAQLSKLRAQVRRVELRTKTRIAKQLDTSHYLLEQLEAFAVRGSRMAASKTLLEQVANQHSWSQAALNWLEEYEANGLRKQIQDLELQLAEWLRPIREQSRAIAEAVEAYQAGYRRALADKLPLQQALSQLEDELDVAQVDFVVPSGPTTIELEVSDIDMLLQGRVSDLLRQRLSEISITSMSDVIQVRQLGQHLWLAFFLDDQAGRHALAVADSGYLPQSVRPGRKVFVLQKKTVDCREIVRAIPANQLGLKDKLAIYFSRWGEFLLENPREANTEGGVFPAIWGTIVMTLIMTVAVVPFGVMAALYLREYTRSGPLISLIRISINNLAGVPSIVYGVFGFSFFCYTIGAFVDGGPKNANIQPWPSNLWFTALAVTAVLGTIAFFFSLVSSGPSHSQRAFTRFASSGAMVLWLVSVAAVAILILKSPFFEGLFSEYLPNPTFGKGGLLWAALTLSLLTLPVVIVATEEALAAVPNSLREGSLACGASKWQTIRRITLPHARPGILTGAILAMARGAGEVAPLMLVGALASAPDLPLDSEFPFFHGSRSFMHLGYQIYTLGFQSQNSEAAKPMVFTCTLLLILIVAALNICAILLRARLKRQFHGNQF